ncbi:di-trans,poly-cis-decaprenylcistransferase [Candidatus Woesearchaeota archaeon]|nr:di-trans,poly-cis-decaprenylcistransferase [Candidatus Woesearchaeota archaeon]MBT3538302.1 di-trans,poly-cis-decaprenylcistransferase [Candidatus Woesearchaeota archaeon]MBT4696704.1 di-trans,poly-cis-decaprenylcistransferase [Candidatus Woesearchaeota archaeon]MBT4716822.1 di-trans,poly-cis-decaprenylcistransferase [Candidatus Woesearchaeota archaeon]MBT7105971.1 di-trans,poly-cis-decaprenylcistransferase [Candidatus Woesearchaeota archaeon]
MDGILTHLGIIMDGNRRFARRLMMKPWKGHEWGAQKLLKIFEWCKELEIEELTLYTFSIQNFNRPKEEFDMLMNIFRDNFDKIKEEEHIVNQNKIKIKFIGRLHLFPEDIQQKAKDIEELTKDYSDYTVNFAFGYGGREEIIDATKKIAELVKENKIQPSEITEELIKENLYMADEPDLIIRTGGDRRTSNFLIFQSSYSEWLFLEKKFPELKKEDIVKCKLDFEKRERRFGK